MSTAADTIEVPRSVLDDLLAEVRDLKASLTVETSRPRPVRPAITKSDLTAEEVATILLRSGYTVRLWCRLGRINARKCNLKSGPHEEWRITGAEVERIREHGLLPIDPQRNARRKPAMAGAGS